MKMNNTHKNLTATCLKVRGVKNPTRPQYADAAIDVMRVREIMDVSWHELGKALAPLAK